MLAHEASGYRLSEVGERVVNGELDPSVPAHFEEVRAHFDAHIIPSGDELNDMADSFLARLSFDRALHACATCGIRELTSVAYEEWPLSFLCNTPFDYDLDAAMAMSTGQPGKESAHQKLAKLDVDVTLHNEDGTTYVKNLKCLRAYYEHRDKCLHVHPHLVVCGADGGEPTVRMCPACTKAAGPLGGRRVPPNSLPMRDFGS